MQPITLSNTIQLISIIAFSSVYGSNPGTPTFGSPSLPIAMPSNHLPGTPLFAASVITACSDSPSSNSFATADGSPKSKAGLVPNYNQLITNIESCKFSDDLLLFVNQTADSIITTYPQTSIECKTKLSVELYLQALYKCASLKIHSHLKTLITSMIHQNNKLGIVSMDINVWNTFFWAYFQRTDIIIKTEYFQYFDTMYHRGSNVKPNTETFNHILRGIAANGNCKSPQIADVVVDETMISYNQTPTRQTYAILMKIYAQNGYPVDYLKATERLLNAHNITKLSGAGTMIADYKECLINAKLSDYNQIIKYLDESLIRSNYESAGVATLVFMKHMKNNKINPNQETYLLMMRLYGNIDAEIYSSLLWEEYKKNGFAKSNDEYTYKILLEYLGIHKRKQNIKIYFKILILLKDYNFNMMNDWNSLNAAIDAIKSINKHKESVMITLQDVLFANCNISKQIRYYLINKISTMTHNDSLLEWFLDDTIIPNKEIYEWIMKMCVKMADCNCFHATKILLNAMNMTISGNDEIITNYKKCFIETNIKTFNQILEWLEDKAFNDNNKIISTSNIAQLIFMRIMPNNNIIPNTKTYLIMMKIYSIMTQNWQHVITLWNMYKKQGLVIYHDMDTIKLILLKLEMFIRKDCDQKHLQQTRKTAANLGFDILLSQKMSFQAMINVAKLNNGFMIIQNIIKDTISQMNLNLNKDNNNSIYRLQLYLMNVIHLTQIIGMHNDDQLWINWLRAHIEETRMYTNCSGESNDKSMDIKQLGLEISLLSIDEESIWIQCIRIIKKMDILNEILGGGWILDLTQFNEKSDKLQIWYTLKYVVWYIVLPNNHDLVIVGSTNIFQVISKEILKDIENEIVGKNMIIKLQQLLQFKLSNLKYWSNLKVSPYEHITYI